MENPSLRHSCTQSGHPTLAGSRLYMMSSCKACDSASWCWSFSYRVGNPACASCEHISWCHPEDVESDDKACLECDEFQVCRAGKASGGSCLFAQQEGGCTCQAAAQESAG
jgi:hypothetical protein